MFQKRSIAIYPKDFKGLGSRKNEWPRCLVHNKAFQPLKPEYRLGPVVCPDCYEADPINAIRLGRYCRTHKMSFLGIAHWPRSWGDKLSSERQCCPKCTAEGREGTYGTWRPFSADFPDVDRYLPWCRPANDGFYDCAWRTPSFRRKQRVLHRSIRLKDFEEWEWAEYADLPRSREAALAEGSKLYFKAENGEYHPCPKGHVAARWVLFDRCTVCHDESRKPSRRKEQSVRNVKRLASGIDKLTHQDRGILMHQTAVSHLVTGDKMHDAIAREKAAKKSGKPLSKNPHAIAKRNRAKAEKWQAAYMGK